jgi:hypothetical protein
MTDVFKAHLDALDAQIELLKVQTAAMRHALDLARAAMQPAQSAAPAPLPERCAGVPASRCAKRDDEARVSRGSFGNPHAWQCSGCGLRGDALAEAAA